MSLTRLHVVGRGIVGLSIAYEAQRAGLHPCVVGCHVPGAATLAATGVSSVKGNIQANSEMFSAKLSAHRQLWPWLEALEKASGKPVARHRGTVEPFQTLTGYEAIRERVFHRLFTGCHGVEVLNSKAVSTVFHNLPEFARQVRGALHYPGDLWYDPVAALVALEHYLRGAGVEFIERKVERIVERADRGLLIETTAGPIEADEVVLAAGVFGQEILDNSGISPPQRLEAVAGETLEGALPQEVRGIINLGRMNLVCAGDRFRFGSSSRALRQGAAYGIDAAAVDDLHRRLASFVAFSTPFSPLWGVRARYRDQRPAVGPLFFPARTRRLFVALGFHKSGLQLAPLFARDLIANVTGASAFFAQSAFSPARFFS